MILSANTFFSLWYRFLSGIQSLCKATMKVENWFKLQLELLFNNLPLPVSFRDYSVNIVASHVHTAAAVT